MCFPIDFTDYRDSPYLFNERVQFTTFVHRLDVWEVEEMTCTFHFLAERLRERIIGLQKELAYKINNHPETIYVDKSHRFWPRRSRSRSSRCRIQDVDSLPFLMTNYHAYMYPHIGYLISKGQQVVQQILDAKPGRDFAQRILPTLGRSRPYLPQAIEHQRATNQRWGPLVTYSDRWDDPRQAGMGFFAYARNDVFSGYRGINNANNQRLRDMAYAF